MANTPNVRFKGFADDWEQRKLGDIADKVTMKNVGTQYVETLTNSAEFGIISQRDFFDHDVSNMENIDGYYVVEDDAFVYNPRISTSAPVGPINRNKLGRTGVMSPLYTVFKTHDIDSEYLEWFFKSSCWYSYMYFNGDTGARSDRFSIKDEVFFEMPIPKPDIGEQGKIGKYLTQLDSLITLHQRKCDEEKQLKKFMLQKMFPKSGELIPEIRFAGVTDDWEQRKVRCFINEGIIEAPMDGNHGEKHPTASEYVSDGIPFLMASDIHNGKADIYHCKYITKERANKLDKGFAKNGDVLITHKATIGEVAILQGLKTEYAVLTPQVTYYRIQDESRLNQKYLYAYFNSEEFQNDLKTKAAQSTRPYIGISAQQNLTINFPINVKEQEQIGTFFENFDHLIALHQRRCDELKEVKRFMLQNMFPQKG